MQGRKYAGISFQLGCVRQRSIPPYWIAWGSMLRSRASILRASLYWHKKLTSLDIKHLPVIHSVGQEHKMDRSFGAAEIILDGQETEWIHTYVRRDLHVCQILCIILLYLCVFFFKSDITGSWSTFAQNQKRFGKLHVPLDIRVRAVLQGEAEINQEREGL